MRRSHDISGDRRILIACFALLLFVCLPPQTAQSQLCPHSRIYLVVRDEHGRITDPTPFSKRRYAAHRFASVGIEMIDVPAAFSAGATRARALRYGSASCTFGPLEETTFEFKGRRMRLVFRNAKRINSDYSTSYTIEAPPFRQGTYEIDLSARRGLLSDPADLTSRSTAAPVIFSADAWREASAAAPNFVQSRRVTFRGRVTNGATGLPVAGAKVELQLGEKVYPAKGTSGPDGGFEIAGVADERLTGADRVSVRAVAVGFAHTEVFIEDHRRLALSRELFDNLDIELRPFVTIGGRMIDAATGRPARISPGAFAAFAFIDEGFTKGDYRTRIYHSTDARPTADGTFTMRVATGRNTFSMQDYQNYQPVAPGTRQELLNQRLEFDVKTGNQPEIVFRVRRVDR